MVLGLEDPHQGEGHPGEYHRGEHDPSQGRRQAVQGGIAVVGEHRHQRLGEQHSQGGEGRRQQRDRRQKAVREAAGGLSALLLQAFAEHRDEAGGDSRGEHRVKKYPGDAAGGKKGVGLHAHAVMDGQEPVPV